MPVQKTDATDSQRPSRHSPLWRALFVIVSGALVSAVLSLPAAASVIDNDNHTEASAPSFDPAEPQAAGPPVTFAGSIPKDPVGINASGAGCRVCLGEAEVPGPGTGPPVPFAGSIPKDPPPCCPPIG